MHFPLARIAIIVNVILIGLIAFVNSGAVTITATSDHDPSKKDTIDITVRVAPIPDSTR